MQRALLRTTTRGARSLRPAAARIPRMTSQATSRLSMVSRHISGSSSRAAAAAPQATSIDANPLLRTKSQNALRVLTLNRPDKLNSLNTDMITGMKPLMEAWESSDQVSLILFKGEGRAFCAGGDVTAATEAAKKDETRSQALEFFRSEYELDNKIARMKTPVITFMDGITMGGGVGLSIHAPFRIATENTKFAMPETGIGLFPDVGASFFLSRMDGRVGAYLGLTSSTVDGWSAYQLGLATHYITSDRLAEVEERLSGLTFQPEQTSDDVHGVINSVLEEFTTEPAADQVSFVSGAKRRAIDTCFKHTELAKVVADLQAIEAGQLLKKDNMQDWAKKTREEIEFRSPQSCAVTLLLLEDAVHFSIDDAFKTDLRIAAAMIDPNVTNDFINGVHQRLVLGKDKEQRNKRAQWNPQSHQDKEALSSEVLRAKFFNSMSPTKLPLPEHTTPKTGHKSYTKYPYARFCLPNENRIGRLVRGEDSSGGSFVMSRRDVHKVLSKEFRNKSGLTQKIDEVLDRRTQQDKDGNLKWVL